LQAKPPGCWLEPWAAVLNKTESQLQEIKAGAQGLVKHPRRAV